MSEKQVEGTRDLDFHQDFDPATGEIKDGEMKAHFDAEREKLLGAPVGSGQAATAYEADKPKVEKADPAEKAVFTDGIGADFLAARYSKKQLTELAGSLGVEVKPKVTAADIAIAVQKAGQAKADASKETSSTVLPASPETNAAKIADIGGGVETKAEDEDDDEIV